MRKLLEGYAAEACAERIEPKELQKLKDLQARLSLCNPPWKGGKRGRSGVPSENRASLRQPVYLADVKAHPDRWDAYALQPKAAVRSDEVRENEHESLLAAIEAGDGALARREMERHLEHVGENLQAYFCEKVGFVRIINKKKFDANHIFDAEFVCARILFLNMLALSEIKIMVCRIKFKTEKENEKGYLKM
ncbi:MAG: hypothetical protein ACLR8P_21695 [Clostridium fessum]